MHNFRVFDYCITWGPSRKQTACSKWVIWGLISRGASCKVVGRVQGSTAIVQYPGPSFSRELLASLGFQEWEKGEVTRTQGREEVSGTRGGESCVERAPGQNCDPYSKQVSNWRSCKNRPSGSPSSLSGTCCGAPVVIGPDPVGKHRLKVLIHVV